MSNQIDVSLIYNNYTNEKIDNDKSIIIKKYNNVKKNANYTTVKYNKNHLLEDEYNTLGLARSIVFNNNNQVLSYSPPKSLNYQDMSFTQDFDSDHIVALEFIDGTMINLFWDNQIDDWEISTKSCVTGNIAFYIQKDSKTFRNMFLEACNDINFDFENLPKTSSDNNQLCYSFVLQHVSNRIVVPYKENKIYLIYVFEIKQTDSNLTVCDYNDERLTDYFKATNVKFPEIYKEKVYFKDIESLKQTYCSDKTPYHIQGVVLYNKTNMMRAKFRNANYEAIRKIRGNQPKIQYRYLSLYKEGNVDHYLKYYPEDKNEFYIFKNELFYYTKHLFMNYVSCFIKKEKPVQDFKYQYRNHMISLHELYIGQLKPLNKYITLEVVINYIKELPTPRLMYVLNYDKKYHEKI